MDKRNPRILFVDDEQTWCLVMEELGVLIGLSITTCQSSKEAFHKFNEEDFDLIITDIRMPDESGFDFIRRIRRISSDIPIIVVTAFHTDKLHSLSEALNIQKFLIKPFRITELEKAIKEYLPAEVVI